MKKSWLVFLALLIVVVNAKAAIDVSSIAVKDTILPGQNAEFLLTMKSDIYDDVSLSYSDDFWRAKFEPSMIGLQAGKSYDNVKVTLYPLSTAKPGSYIFHVRIVSKQTNTIVKEYPLEVTLADKDNAIGVEMLTPALDPALKDNLLQIKFSNNYNIALENVKTTIESDLFTHDTILNLGPGEETVEDVTVNLDDNSVEGSHDVNIKFYINDVYLTTVKKTIDVGRVKDVRKSIDFAGGLFSKVKEVKIVNEGNSIVKETYGESFGLLEDFFTSVSPQPDRIVKQEEGRVYTWDVNLKPGEAATILITTGYRGFILVMIILLVLVGLWYFLMGREITITKKVSNVTGEHDAFGSIKVSLHVRNKSRQRMYNLRVLDKIPGYIRPEKEEFSGMHPLNVKRTLGGGQALIWNIPGLERGGETVISYRVKTKLPVFGKIMLPTATVRYRNIKGRIVNSYSNKMILFSLPGSNSN